MATLTATVPTRLGTASPGNNVAASDVVPASALGVNGAILEILNGNAAADNMTISDSSTTPSGAAAAANAPTIAAGANRVFKLSPKQADANGNITVTHSVQTTVTYKLYPLG